MAITEEQFQRMERCFPTQRGNVKLSNLAVLVGRRGPDPSRFPARIRPSSYSYRSKAEFLSISGKDPALGALIPLEG